MTDIKLINDITVALEDHMGNDLSVVRSAQVSLKGKNDPVDAAKAKGLINYLMREKHGSPFEHNAMTFYVKAPIFVAREHMRHRMSSFNEVSGRYSKLKPEFYVPATERPLVNIGSSAKPEFAPGEVFQVLLTQRELEASYRVAWDVYEELLDKGVANEVARSALPVGIFTEYYYTANLRSLFNFLALRTRDDRATHTSRPQHEIELVAREIEKHVEALFPASYEAWNANGRVAP